MVFLFSWDSFTKHATHTHTHRKFWIILPSGYIYYTKIVLYAYSISLIKFPDTRRARPIESNAAGMYLLACDCCVGRTVLHSCIYVCIVCVAKTRKPLALQLSAILWFQKMAEINSRSNIRSSHKLCMHKVSIWYVTICDEYSVGFSFALFLLKVFCHSKSICDWMRESLLCKQQQTMRKE